MDDLFSKSASIFGSAVVLDAGAKGLTKDERNDIVGDWVEDWRGSPKNGGARARLGRMRSLQYVVALMGLPEICEKIAKAEEALAGRGVAVLSGRCCDGS